MFIAAIIMIVVFLGWLRLTWQQCIMISTAKFTPPFYTTLLCLVTATQTTETQLILLNDI
jgi:hypothetical protein